MAVHSIKIRRCDMCQADGAKSWFIQTPDRRRVEVDLCGKHSTPLEAVVDAGRPGRARRASTRDGIDVQAAKPR